MNETIGVKGGKNDRRRRLRITKEFKEKLELYQKEQHEKEIKELEKKVNFLQKITFIKILPIVIIGQIYQTLTEDNEKKRQLALKEVIARLERENAFSDQEKQTIITALSNYDLFSLDDELLGKLGIAREGYKQVSEIDLTDFTGGKNTILETEKVAESQQQVISQETKNMLIKANSLAKEKKYLTTITNEQQLTEKDKEQVITSTPEEKIEAGITALDSFNDQLDKLKNHKIVTKYENKLKEVRQDLRQVIFEYNVIVSEADNVYDSNEAEELLTRLNEIIKKVEELKHALNVENIDKYDDNYLYTLVEDYMESFNNQNFVSEIKDSNLYMMLSSKLNELDTKKDKLQGKIEKRKVALAIDEQQLEDLKEKYYGFEKIERTILEFQTTQDKLLDEINQKMATATTIKDRVEVQVQGMTRQSRRLLTALSASMLLPGARSARSVATMTALSLYFMRNVMNPRTVTKRYKVVKTTDYVKEIENSLSQLDDVSTLLNKTSRQLDRTIKDFEKEFAEYINVLPECQELLQNLEKIRDELKTKEYELDKIKEQQEKNLEKNNAKVKSLNYEMAV